MRSERRRTTSPSSPGRGTGRRSPLLCRSAEVRGNLVPDAYLAAMAIERGAVMCTADRGFGRFPGLRWRDPCNEPIDPSP